MNIGISEKQKNLRTSTGTTFYIIGPRRLQNELIATCLESNTGNECVVLESINQITTDTSKTNLKPRLLFWDCHEKNLKKLFYELRTYIKKKKNTSNHIVLFNVPTDLEFQKKIVLQGIQGIFYQHDPLDNFIKGVRAVLDGKLWLSREMMTKYIFEGTGKDRSSESISEKLTERQIEILALIAVGDTNDEIADKLCISLHTVKTHLYKIFKKINVPNRVQAALWAVSNL
jgi:DNA-binding NarL/FixJ family response regulator